MKYGSDAVFGGCVAVLFNVKRWLCKIVMEEISNGICWACVRRIKQ